MVIWFLKKAVVGKKLGWNMSLVSIRTTIVTPLPSPVGSQEVGCHTQHIGQHLTNQHKPFGGVAKNFLGPNGWSQVCDYVLCYISRLISGQWFQSLFKCRIVTLNFSMGFNIAPYTDCVTPMGVGPALNLHVSYDFVRHGSYNFV